MKKRQKNSNQNQKERTTMNGKNEELDLYLNEMEDTYGTVFSAFAGNTDSIEKLEGQSSNN